MSLRHLQGFSPVAATSPPAFAPARPDQLRLCLGAAGELVGPHRDRRRAISERGRVLRAAVGISVRRHNRGGTVSCELCTADELCECTMLQLVALEEANAYPNCQSFPSAELAQRPSDDAEAP